MSPLGRDRSQRPLPLQDPAAIRALRHIERETFFIRKAPFGVLELLVDSGTGDVTARLRGSRGVRSVQLDSGKGNYPSIGTAESATVHNGRSFEPDVFGTLETLTTGQNAHITCLLWSQEDGVGNMVVLRARTEDFP